MKFIPLFTGFYTSQVVRQIPSINSIYFVIPFWWVSHSTFHVKQKLHEGRLGLSHLALHTFTPWCINAGSILGDVPWRAMVGWWWWRRGWLGIVHLRLEFNWLDQCWQMAWLYINMLCGICSTSFYIIPNYTVLVLCIEACLGIRCEAFQLGILFHHNFNLTIFLPIWVTVPWLW